MQGNPCGIRGVVAAVTEKSIMIPQKTKNLSNNPAFWFIPKGNEISTLKRY